MSGDAYVFAPDERPMSPGSPFTPAHPAWRRMAYALVALMAGPASSFSNALVNTNAASLGGEIGVFAYQLSLLPAVFVGMNATANLTLVKARAQFGIPSVLNVVLVAYIAASLLQLLAPSFALAVLVRGVGGVASAVLATITVLSLLQAFPAKHRIAGLLIGISLPQLGTPLARMVPVDLLVEDHWRGLRMIELGLALGLLAAVNLLPLPPTEREKAFERLDFFTIALLVPASLLLAVALSEGRTLWWTDTPWLGWALALAIPLLVAGFLVETHRARPLLNVRWMRGADILRFLLVATLVRVALAEQSYSAVGLLTSGGLNNDQLRALFGVVAVAMLAGGAMAVMTFSERRLPYQVIAACLAIALGAWMDSQANSITRPPQLYLSQALIGLGTTLFVGPTLLFGLAQMLRRGSDVLISVVVSFSITQNFGGLAGSALLGTLQTIYARAHAASLSEPVTLADPLVADRLQAGAHALATSVDDPLILPAQGAGLLGRAVNGEAAVLAFDDTFRVVAVVAVATAAYITFNLLRQRWRAAEGRAA